MSGLDPLFSLEGKVALVTGGAHGMGRMIAEAFLRQGARVHVTSRKADVCAAAAAEMCGLGPCIAAPADLSTPDAVGALARHILDLEPRIDVLVNNAGRTWGAPLADFPDKAWPGVMAVNVQAPFTLVRDLLPTLKASGATGEPARVINIGSLAGHAVERLGAYSYTASKAALHHLTRELAADLAEFNITANVVAPGYFPTGMTAHIRADAERTDALTARVPLGRLGRPEDIAGACVFLASPAGAYVTGAVIPVDGGLSGCR